jgi:hypothetical protein
MADFERTLTAFSPLFNASGGAGNANLYNTGAGGIGGFANGILSNPVAKIGLSFIPGGSAISSGLGLLSGLFGGGSPSGMITSDLIRKYGEAPTFVLGVTDTSSPKFVAVLGSSEVWAVQNGVKALSPIQDASQLLSTVGRANLMLISQSNLDRIPRGDVSFAIPKNLNGVGMMNTVVNDQPTFQSLNGQTTLVPSSASSGVNIVLVVVGVLVALFLLLRRK